MVTPRPTPRSVTLVDSQLVCLRPVSILTIYVYSKYMLKLTNFQGCNCIIYSFPYVSKLHRKKKIITFWLGEQYSMYFGTG